MHFSPRNSDTCRIAEQLADDTSWGHLKGTTIQGLAHRIMIVEDESEISNLFSVILSQAGFVVGPFAYDGEEAVQEFRKHSEEVYVVLMDMRVPKKDGIEASMQIKEIRPDTKILMVNAYEIPRENTHLFDAILTKPVKREELVVAVSNALQSGKNRGETQ